MSVYRICAATRKPCGHCSVPTIEAKLVEHGMPFVEHTELLCESCKDLRMEQEMETLIRESGFFAAL